MYLDDILAYQPRDQAEAEAARGELAARGVFQEESEAASKKGSGGTP